MTHALDSTGMHGAPTARSSPPHTWLWAAMIVALIVVAGAIGYAVYDSTTGSETSTESVAVASAGSDSVAIVQSEIEAALALKTAPPSSVEIVNAEIDKALMGFDSATSSVEIVNAEIEAALAGSPTDVTVPSYPEVSAAERELLAEHGMTPPRP